MVVAVGCGHRATVPDLASIASDDGGVDAGEVLPKRSVVRGRVFYEASPQADVLVRLGTAGHTRSARTDKNGTFELTDVAPGAYALASALPGKGLGAFQPVDVDEGVLAQVTVDLVPTARLAGIVRDDAGKPLAGALVKIEEEDRPLPVSLETLADGRFVVEGRIKSRAYRVSGRRAGFLPDGPRFVRAGGAPIDIKLARGAMLDGTVVDERGDAIVGAEIAVVSDVEGGEVLPTGPSSMTIDATSGWARLEPAGELGILRGSVPYPPLVAPASTAAPATSSISLPRTDGKGSFHVAELPAGSVIVTARHPDYAGAASVPLLLVAGQARSVHVILLRGATVRGRVLDDRSRGIGDVQVTTSDGRTALSDVDGHFVIEHVVTRLKLSARRAGYLRVEDIVDVGEGQREVAIDLHLERALGRLGGEVVDERGAGVEHARITVTPHGADPVSATTDARGGFLVEALPIGPYRVVIEHDGYARTSLPSVEATNDARLVLQRGGGIEGELFDARSGQAPVDAKLDVVTGAERIHVPLDGRRFRVLALPVGPARLVATAHGYPTLDRAIDIPPSDREGEVTVRDLRLELELGGTVRGRVRDDRGERVVGAVVDVLSGGVPTAHTDSEGVFQLVGVPSGRVRLRASYGDRSGEDEVEVRANEESRIDLTIDAR